jgi:hypothetical protein
MAVEIIFFSPLFMNQRVLVQKLDMPNWLLRNAKNSCCPVILVEDT